MGIWQDSLKDMALTTPEISRVKFPLNYGSDLSCRFEVDPNMLETDPNSIDGLMEFAIRAITTPRGSNPDAPDQGIDVRQWLNAPVTQQDLRAYGGITRGELERDDRISVAECVVTYDSAIKSLFFRCRLTPVDPALAQFQFILIAPLSGLLEILS